MLTRNDCSAHNNSSASVNVLSLIEPSVSLRSPLRSQLSLTLRCLRCDFVCCCGPVFVIGICRTTHAGTHQSLCAVGLLDEVRHFGPTKGRIGTVFVRDNVCDSFRRAKIALRICAIKRRAPVA